MELYLMQHGSCLPAGADPQRPLSPVGGDQVAAAARAIAALGLTPDVILASPKLRSLQTAAIVVETLGLSERSIRQTDLAMAMAPARETIDFLAGLPCRRTLLVGHLPSLAEIASLLLAREGRVELQFENAGLSRLDVLDFTRPTASLVFHLQRNQLALLGRQTI